MARPVRDAIQLTAEQHQFLELTTDFAARDIRPVARVVDDAQVESPLDLWRAAAKIGLTAFMLPADVGGGVTDLLTQARIQEELCHGDIAIGNLVTSNGFYAAPILELGTAEQRARWLEPLGTLPRYVPGSFLYPTGLGALGLLPSSRDRRQDRPPVRQGGHAARRRRLHAHRA
jgi:alkylation response protein AidB-like acyl-CoA dehydrogenase